MSAAVKALRVVLGDQLSPGLSALRDADPETDVVFMAEVEEEATYVRHHKKKIAFLFSAMRHFAEELEGQGFTVDYIKLTDKENTQTLTGEVARAAKRHEVAHIVATECGEFRLAEKMKRWGKEAGVPCEVRPDTRFFCSHERFAQWAEGRKALTMEYFYREMRKEHDLLMNRDGGPYQGKWNFDKQNRESLPEGHEPPELTRFEPDDITAEVLDLVEERFGDHFGTLEGFNFAVTREEAERAFDDFIENRLKNFGAYQDAMAMDERFLYHSVISPYLNAGLLDPYAVCRRAEHAYFEGEVPINAAEGFIRQILGWREFVRGVYWLKMPDYAETNTFGADRPLPDFFWTGETEMTCLAQAVAQTREEAYAHHIQRLMVTGLFALLAGLDPEAVNEWYMIVYADAYEWVELPNTHGMALYADEGFLASKPYAASGKYINRMSNYCGSCRYKVSKTVEDDACPFNALYWNFLDQHREALEENGRIGPVLGNLDRFSDEKLNGIRERAKAILKDPDAF